MLYKYKQNLDFQFNDGRFIYGLLEGHIHDLPKQKLCLCQFLPEIPRKQPKIKGAFRLNYMGILSILARD